jgi:flagellar biosynthetic protein FliP
MRRFLSSFILLALFLTVAPEAALWAQNTAAPGIDLQLRLGDAEEGTDVSVAIQLVFLMTLLSLAPAIVLLMTSFLRIIIVLGFIRNAMGLQSTPPNQVLVGMALFLTFFLMMPVGEQIQEEALGPMRAGEITSMEALDRAAVPLRDFMLRQTRPGDIDFFLGMAGLPQTTPDELPMRVVIPSFVMSELRTAFQMGFLIFLPFLVVDFIIATVLMAMGMMMMPPVIVSLPFKILLFVLVDGWYLIVQSIVRSF